MKLNTLKVRHSAHDMFLAPEARTRN